VIFFKELQNVLHHRVFIRFKTGVSHVNAGDQVQTISRLAEVVNDLHYKACGTPLPITLVNTRHGYCLYTGETCLVTGTIEECGKYLKALVWLSHTILLKGTP